MFAQGSSASDVCCSSSPDLAPPTPLVHSMTLVRRRQWVWIPKTPFNRRFASVSPNPGQFDKFARQIPIVRCRPVWEFCSLTLLALLSPLHAALHCREANASPPCSSYARLACRRLWLMVARARVGNKRSALLPHLPRYVHAHTHAT